MQAEVRSTERSVERARDGRVVVGKVALRCVLGLLAGGLLLSGAVVRAQAPGAGEGPRDELTSLIERVGLRRRPADVKALAGRILDGLPPERLQQALEALEAAGRKEAAPAIERLLRHRRPQVRVAAVRLVVACRPAQRAAWLKRALDDPDPRVRGAAAEAIGDLRVADAVPLLFQALDRGMLEAAMPLGRLVKAEQVERLLGHLGRVPFEVFGPALTELVARRDLPVSARLLVVARLESLATPDAKGLLEAIAAALPGRGADVDRLRRAARDAAAHIAPGGDQ